MTAAAQCTRRNGKHKPNDYRKSADMTCLVCGGDAEKEWWQRRTRHQRRLGVLAPFGVAALFAFVGLGLWAMNAADADRDRRDDERQAACKALGGVVVVVDWWHWNCGHPDGGWIDVKAIP